MSDHRIESVAIDDGEMNLHVWTPASTSGPGVLVIQEIYGVSANIRAVAGRLSDSGYVVAAPDVFWRFAPGWEREPDEAGTAEGLAQAANLDFPQAIDDCGAALDHLRSLSEVSGPAGVLGFCLGGSLAFAVAAKFDPAVCVSYYGSRVPSMITQLDDIDCPTLLHFGSLDPYIPGDGVDALAEAIAGRDDMLLNVEIAGHAFDNEAPLWHNEAAANSAWSKTVAFLAEHLPAT